MASLVSQDLGPQAPINGRKKTSGWSFLKVLENPSMAAKNFDEIEEVYVHPMVKRSASALSTKSLEMCTESLGSETGSDVSESGDEFVSLSWEERERVRSVQRSKFRVFDRKVHRVDFPPPLTSISGSSDATVKVRHHREGGRLVIKAVSVSNCGTAFQAERTNGRLTLSLTRDCFGNKENGRGEFEENEEVGGVEMESESESENEYVPSDDDDEEGDNDDVAVVDDVATEEEAEGGGGWRWDMDGNRWRIGCPTGKRLTRCKEGDNGNKVFANWGSSWVAIS